MFKILNPCKGKTYGGRGYNIYVSVEYRDGRLSISGVSGPLSGGNCLGGCGQILGDVRRGEPTQDWSPEMVEKLLEVWSKYHLNDLHAECEHQRELGWTYETHKGQKCPVCDYQIGTEWKFMPVPRDVIDWLRSLPESQTTPAWI